MKNPQTTRLIEYLVGVLATGLIALGLLLYAFFEPDRIASAQDQQIAADLDNAAMLYAQNCAVCHGLAGEGIGSIPALATESLSQVDFDTLYKIISRGLYDTAMPAWSKEDGGPLGDYQIEELVTMIQQGDWQVVQDRVVNLGLAPLVPFTAEPDSQVLEQLADLLLGDQIVAGIELYAQECVACHGPDGMGTTLAPALNAPEIQSRSPEELERVILNGVSGTLMAGWQNTLGEADIEALITLLVDWEQVPTGAIPAPDRPVAVTEESLALGAELYTNNCSSCHGPEGQGTPRAPALNVQGFLADTNDAAIQQIITLGVPGTHMPAWGDRMTDAEIQAIVGFLRAWEPTAPAVAESTRGGGGPWWQTQGTTSSGTSAGQGPPWQRQQSATTTSGTLPSGGAAPTSVALQPSGTTGESVGARGTGNGTTHSSGAGGQAAASGQADAGATATDGGPPWAQTVTPLETTVGLDSRALGILASLVLLSLILVGGALVGLHRVQQAERQATEAPAG